MLQADPRVQFHWHTDDSWTFCIRYLFIQLSKYLPSDMECASQKSQVQSRTLVIAPLSVSPHPTSSHPCKCHNYPPRHQSENPEVGFGTLSLHSTLPPRTQAFSLRFPTATSCPFSPSSDPSCLPKPILGLSSIHVSGSALLGYANLWLGRALHLCHSKRHHTWPQSTSYPQAGTAFPLASLWCDGAPYIQILEKSHMLQASPSPSFFFFFF